MSPEGEGGCGGGQLPPEEMAGIFLSEPSLGGLLNDLDGLIGPGGALPNLQTPSP